MSERSRGFLVLFVAAAAAGVYFGVTREGPKRRPESLPASSVPGPPIGPQLAPPRAATKAEVEATINSLTLAVKKGAADPKSPWALAHGLVAFGPEFAAADGRSATTVIVSFAEPKEVGGEKLWLFPETKGNEPVEPHRFLLVKTLLELGVPLDTGFATSTGEKVTLRRLVADLRILAQPPKTDADFHHVAWQISALASGVEREPKDTTATALLSPLIEQGLARLEADQKIVEGYSGPPDKAFDEGSPLNAAKREKSGIYGHSCGGLHLLQALLSAVAVRGSEDDKRRMRRQLGVLLYRYELERPAYASLLARHPEQGLLIRLQQQKFFGHLVETLTLARSLGLTLPETEGGKKIDQTVRMAAADEVDAAGQLIGGGVYERLDSIRKDRQQTYLDLIGDGCHALRGLRRALPLLK